MQENKEEKLTDIKQALVQFIQPDEPEIDQEEAIKKYTEKKTSTSDDDTTDEQDHLERIKHELLESLERVKKLEKHIFYETEIDEKKRIKIEKLSSSGNSMKKQQEIEQYMESKEKERE